MSFNTGLSGIRAANTDLSVTGNNIANAGTIGFKSSRAEFGDVYTSSLLGGGSNVPGSGVTTLTSIIFCNLVIIAAIIGKSNLA